MKATKKLLCMALAMTTIGTSAVHAQRVTYNHDTSKKNQVTVMELGSGSLTPELYYTLLHRNYKKSAAQKNKQSFQLQVLRSTIKWMKRRQSILLSLQGQRLKR